MTNLRLSDYFKKAKSGTLQAVMDQTNTDLIFASIISGRCGSTYLSNICTRIGFGRGEEPFNEFPRELLERVAPDREISRFLEKMFNANNLNKNVYFQITPARINVLCEVISRKELLGKVEFFSLIFRRNIIAQAISYHNAIRTGLWHSNHSSQSDTEKEFDPLEVLKWICNISAMEGEALSFVRDRRVLMIFYEDLISAPFETLSLFLGYHNFEFESSRLSEILVGDSGPRKISRSGYDED